MSARGLSSVSDAVRVGVVFLISSGLTAALTAVTIRVCNQRGWVSKPRPDRWHAGTPAFFGGVPIYAGFLSVSALFIPTSDRWTWTIAGLSTLVFLLGFLDDIFHLAPRQKLLGQVAVAVLALNCGFVCMASNSALLNVAASLLWIVGITNAFNLLDNMDGLCAGTAMIAALYLAILCVLGGPHAFAVLICAVAGSMAGFLLFNFHPARIFMGDSGSLFIGFLVANIFLVLPGRSSFVPVSVFTPVILLAVPILDTLLVSVSRRLRGQPISQGGTDHTSHRLVRLGMKERSAVLLLYAFTAFSGSIALLARVLPYSQAVALMSLWLALMFVLGILLFYQHAGIRLKSPPQPGLRESRDFSPQSGRNTLAQDVSPGWK